MDDREKLARRQHFRVIVTEILMVVAVLLLVGFLSLIVMGYSFNFGRIGTAEEIVERMGLVQMSSAPSGATIAIDGNTPLLFRTNASRTMGAGEHEISFSKDGFDGWSKKINVVEGLVYRLNYPRLFLKERTVEEVISFPSESTISFVSVSPNKERMIIVIDGELEVVELNSNTPELKPIDLTRKTADGLEQTQKIESIENAKWSGNSEKLLATVNGELTIINVRVPAESVYWSELTVEKTEQNVSERSADETSENLLGSDRDAKIVANKIDFSSETGDRLLLLTDNGELREVDVRSKEISAALLKKVIKFDNDGDRVVFLTEAKQAVEDFAGLEEKETELVNETKDVFEVRAYVVGEEESHLVKTIDRVEGVDSGTIKLVAMRYFLESYIMVAINNDIEVLAGMGWPVKDNALKSVYEETLEFPVQKLNKRGKGMVFGIIGEEKQAVFDIEAMKTVAVEMGGGENGWIDEYLRYFIGEDGALRLRDYDGLNERIMVKSGVLPNKTVTISGNDRWMYYFVNTEDGIRLVREKVI